MPTPSSFEATSSMRRITCRCSSTPTRYIVVNSGFTFWREGSASNAQQTLKLPDFALMDMTAEATGRPEDKIPFVGFIGERWEVLKP